MKFHIVISMYSVVNSKVHFLRHLFSSLTEQEKTVLGHIRTYLFDFTTYIDVFFSGSTVVQRAEDNCDC